LPSLCPPYDSLATLSDDTTRVHDVLPEAACDAWVDFFLLLLLFF
jgi:hypothetical protein